MKFNFLFYTAATLAILAFPAASQAETLTTKTVVETKDLPNINQINFSAFDVNQDGSYSMAEVGDKLFDIFDSNKDKMIDNIEWDNRNVYTITPMEKTTFNFVDHNDDGRAEHATYTYETFYKASGLIKFDENQNGLSAKEFIGAGFENLDDDEDKLITREEWKEAYLKHLPEHAQPETYNGGH